MAFRTRRQYRYDLLRKSGFLPFEARSLSRVPLRIPYLDQLIKERFIAYQQAAKEGQTRAKWQRSIKNRYRGENWINLRGQTDPWKMFRAFEYTYRAKHPEYESPWEKRRRQMKDFIATVEKEIVELPEKKPRKVSRRTKKFMEQQTKEIQRQFDYIEEQRRKREEER